MADLHQCATHVPYDGYGPAIERCDEREDGTLWASNGEYGSWVAFCPFCGYRAVRPPPMRTAAEHAGFTAQESIEAVRGTARTPT